MIRSLLKLALFLVVGILVYNYFLGTPSEKETSRKIFTEVKEVGVSVADLLRSEKQKFDSGKYDQALDKLGSIYQGLKKQGSKLSQEQRRRIEDLERQRGDLERSVRQTSLDMEGDSFNEEEKSGKTRQLNDELQRLLRETERLVSEMEQVD
jgi:hypothetical protein